MINVNLEMASYSITWSALLESIVIFFNYTYKLFKHTKKKPGLRMSPLPSMKDYSPLLNSQAVYKFQ